MILYHWTQPKHLPGIRERGLLPHVPGAVHGEIGHAVPMLTLGKPVVWLSSGLDDWGGDKDAHRLTVQLGANSKRLANYLTWTRQQNHPALLDLLAKPDFKQPDAARVYVYFGTISRGQIIEGLWVPMSPKIEGEW